MQWKRLRRLLNRPVKLIARSTNATLPLSDWYLTIVNRARGYAVLVNPATGYEIPVGPRELRGYERRSGYDCLDLKVGLFFRCPNAWFVYDDGIKKRVAEANSVTRWR